MCVVALGWQAHPRWRLIVAGNRDEFHERPSAAISRWGDVPGVIAGRDLRSGGTWMGVSEAGRFVVVTNVRTGLDPNPALQSRGALVTGLLAGDDPQAVATPDALARFNPFSLISIGAGAAWHLSNHPAPIGRVVPSGIHALSNGAIGQSWPRKDRLEASLAHWLAGDAIDPQTLFPLLMDEAAGPEEDGGAPIFIRDGHYGTRCSTVLAVGADGQGQIIERRFGPEGMMLGETALGFSWGEVKA